MIAAGDVVRVRTAVSTFAIEGMKHFTDYTVAGVVLGGYLTLEGFPEHVAYNGDCFYVVPESADPSTAVEPLPATT